MPEAPSSAIALSAVQRLRVRIRHALRFVRHRGRELLGFMLSHLGGKVVVADHLSTSGIERVLICRINGRMGNTLFLTPLIRRLHELLPNASIDLASAYPLAPTLLQGMPGLRRVLVLPYKSANPWRYVRALRALRAEHYDLAIDPTPESSSGRTALSLARARYKLGFSTHSQWARLTHAVQLPREPMHQAIHPVYLLAHIFGAEYDPRAIQLWLPLTPAERASGQQAVAEAIGCPPGQSALRAFGFFTNAATNKLIPAAWWQQFWDAFLALEPLAIPLEFLPSATQAPIVAAARTLHLPSQRALTSAIAATRLFITTDAGPMHLASSTAVGTIGLFSATDPTLYRPLKPNDRALDISVLSAQQVALQCQQLWRQAASSSL